MPYCTRCDNRKATTFCDFCEEPICNDPDCAHKCFSHGEHSILLRTICCVCQQDRMVPEPEKVRSYLYRAFNHVLDACDEPLGQRLPRTTTCAFQRLFSARRLDLGAGKGEGGVMKQTRTVEVEICDFCKENEARYSAHCLRCNAIACYKCQETAGTEYQHAVYFSGSYDGWYCANCVAALTARPEPLFEAYRQIARLRAEVEVWGEDFKKRSDAAEESLNKLLVVRKGTHA